MRRRGAFSLVEVMVVVAIIGVMSAVAVFTINQTMQSSRERGAARGVSALIKRARALAVQDHAMVSVVTTATSIRLQACPARYGTNLCVGLQPKVDVHNADLRLGSGTDSGGVALTGAPGTPLEFGTNGFPTAPGSAPFSYTLDHPQTPGVARVVVTAGGDVRVQ